MNLGKLLGAGKSFISGEKPAAYREDKRFYLPQFVSPKNPFAIPAPLPAPIEPTKAPVTVAPAKKRELPWIKTKKMPVAAARATAWVSKLNPASIFGSAPPAASSHVTPVQVELSLERVKVVHNDLTDADVEIVPMKSRPARAAAPAPADKKPWADLGERIMKATAL
jgi:hypothetical protein